MYKPDLAKLTEDMGELRENAILSEVRRIISEAPSCAEAAVKALCGGMEIVGDYFEASEYFVGDLIYAGELFTEAFDLLKPLFEIPEETVGSYKVLLATVEGDLHDIGKNIVKIAIQSKGIKVIDLGVNVSPSQIVRTAIEENVSAVALSAVLTSAIESMSRTIDLFKKEGVRDQVTIVVGGACMNQFTADRIGADAFGHTPDETAAICLDACNRAAVRAEA